MAAESDDVCTVEVVSDERLDDLLDVVADTGGGGVNVVVPVAHGLADLGRGEVAEPVLEVAVKPLAGLRFEVAGKKNILN